MQTLVASEANATRAISHDVFDALNLPHSERFAVWRDSVLPLFEPLLPRESAQEFFARVDGFAFERLLLCLCDFSAQGFFRGRHHRADEGADHLLVQLYVTGGYVGYNGRRPVRVRPGDISLLDLGYSLETRADASSTLSLVIPRDLMFSIVQPKRLQPGRVIDGSSAVGGILGHHLRNVWRALRSASVEEEATISQTLLGAVAGAFSGDEADDLFNSDLEYAALDAICDYIQSNLSSPELTPQQLCRRFACSRACLDRLFEPLGGVSAYIHHARACRASSQQSSLPSYRPALHGWLRQL